MSDPNLTTLRALVDVCRKTLETELCELIEELGPTLIDGARALASTSRDKSDPKDYLLLHAQLRDNWSTVTPLFRDALVRRTRPGKSNDGFRPDDESLASLQILGDDELGAQLAMRTVVERVSAACNEETSALDRRITFLVLRTVLAQGDTTFRVTSVCACLETACTAIFPEAKLRTLLLQLLGGPLAAELPQLYRAINETLIDADILPRLKRSYRNATVASAGVAAAESAHMISTLDRLAKARTPVGGIGAAPVDAAAGRNFLSSLQTLEKAPETAAAGALTNVVRLARDSEAARHVQPVEAVALDIVSALFDLIFSDAEISDGIKLLVSRLQMPVLKVAMINQQFFADRSHPARRFLDSISGIAIRWGKFVNASDPFYQKLSELVERVQNTYDGDLGVFEAAITELSEFIAERDVIETEANRVLAEAVSAREEDIGQQREGQARAQQAADEALIPLLTPAVPKAIEQFLRSYWRDVLQSRIYLAEPSGVTLARSLQIASELIWSVAPKKEADDRRRQSAMLPTLLKNLNKGLDEIGITVEVRRAFMNMLADLSMSALRGEAPVEAKPASAGTKLETRPAVARPGATLQVSHAIKGGARVQDISLPTGDDRGVEDTPDRANIRRVRQLVRGDWVDFINVGQTLRERLTWINPSRTLILFSNHATECAISITPEALALRLQNHTAMLVKPDTPMFERAIGGAVKSIDNNT